MKKIERDTFIMYRSFYESVQGLDKNIIADVFTAICEYSFNGKEIELKGISKNIFILIKPQLEANNRKYLNGKQGGRPEKNWENSQKPNHNLNETKTKPNHNLMYNDKGIMYNEEGIMNNDIDINKFISADADVEQNDAEESKLVDITSTDIWYAYKCNNNRKGKIEDVEKILKKLSLEEKHNALREVRLLTFEIRLNIIDGDRCKTCANAIKSVVVDEEQIACRVEKIVEKLKTHKCKMKKTKDEWEREVKEYFGEYLEYAKEPEPKDDNEWIQLYHKYHMEYRDKEFREKYPDKYYYVHEKRALWCTTSKTN